MPDIPEDVKRQALDVTAGLQSGPNAVRDGSEAIEKPGLDKNSASEHLVNDAPKAVDPYSQSQALAQEREAAKTSVMEQNADRYAEQQKEQEQGRDI